MKLLYSSFSETFEYLIFMHQCLQNFRLQNRSSEMSQEAYVPSSFTLCTLESFGHHPAKISNKSQTNHQVRNEAKFIPDFLRIPRKAYDKESLLEQIRMQKMRTRQATTCNSLLKRNLSNSRLIKKPNPPVQLSKTECLKRQIELLLAQIAKQDQEIIKIKTSKKYNRYKELLSSKYVYQEQITVLKKKVKTCKYAISEQRRVYKEHRKREKDLMEMNRAIQGKLIRENQQLFEELQVIKQLERDNHVKNMIKIKERARLLREIADLQRLTGKIYIIEVMEQVEMIKEEDSQRELFETNQEPIKSSIKTKQHASRFQKEEIIKDYCESQAQLSEDDSSDYNQKDEYQEQNSKSSNAEQEEQRHNLSY